MTTTRRTFLRLLGLAGAGLVLEPASLARGLARTNPASLDASALTLDSMQRWATNLAYCRGQQWILTNATVRDAYLALLHADAPRPVLNNKLYKRPGRC